MVPKSNTMMLKDHLHQDDEPSCTAGSSTLGHLPTPVAPIRRKRFVTIFATFIVLIGAAATVSFLYIWITSAKEDEQERFDRRASAVIQEIEAAWEDYEYAALWTHGACRRQNFTRGDFRELYLYLRSGGLQFQAVEFVPNVTRDERAQVEEEDRDFYRAHYPGIEYYGFKGVEEDPEGGVSIQNRSIQPFYFPIRYVEPVETNAAAIGFDLYSSANTKTAIEHALKTWKPTLTTRIQLLQEEDPSSFSVLLMHPGVSLEEIDPNIKPRDLSLLVIRMPALLERASRHETESVGMYLYDKTVSPPQFLGGISMRVHEDNGKMIREVELFPEIELDELLASKDSEAVDILRQEISALSTTWEIVVIPVNDAYESDLAFVWFAGAVIFCASVSMALCLFLKMRSATVMDQIISDAEADKAIVSSLFPSAIRRRLEADFKANHDRPRLLDGNADHCTSTYIFGSAPIADLFPEVSVMYADMVGFSAWSSVRDPGQVFTLLETIYHAFDELSKKRNVFKVEIVGDCYVACAGIPEPIEDHALVIARYACDCMVEMPEITDKLEQFLGPETAELSIRVGLHSGPVTAGVLRGDKGRFQLFGETMGLTSRMESTGEEGKIHVSDATAQLIMKGGKQEWLEDSTSTIHTKGKGALKTYWLNIKAVTGVTPRRLSASIRGQDDPVVIHMPQRTITPPKGKLDSRTRRLIDWNVKTLERYLRQIVVRRMVVEGSRSCEFNIPEAPGKRRFTKTGLVLDEVVTIIKLPKFDAKAVMKADKIDPNSIELDPDVLPQLEDFVTRIGLLYRPNPFHNFEHASHVTMSVVKLLSRIVNPKILKIQNNNQKGTDERLAACNLHDYTFGITSDPLTQFACVFSALIHDVDHVGVPNAVLVQEHDAVAVKYQDKSVLEQNSLDLAWSILMEHRYDALRACLFADEEQLMHFRQLLVNIVLATDICDKELKELRNARWDKAFKGESSNTDTEEESIEAVNRKATIVLEHLIQASDVAHTMQHWHVYRKWNEQFFFECYDAYQQGRLEKDPSESWYNGEIGFFDFYIIPLANKLETCGVFGVSSQEYKIYATENREEWVRKGEPLVASYLENYNATHSGQHTKTEEEMYSRRISV